MLKANSEVARWNGKYKTSFEQSVVDPCPVKPIGESELTRFIAEQDIFGPVLELASGKGANALYLAQTGLDVVAVDCAFNGVIQGQRTANSLGLQLSSVVCDLGRTDFPDGYFGLISVVRYLDRSLFSKIPNWIRPGGLLFYKTFNKNHLIRHPGFNPSFLVEAGELNQAFLEMEILHSDLEDDDPDRSSSFILARRS